MSGVAKDDSNPTVPEEAVPAVGDAETGHAEAAQTEAASAESESRSRRTAPHLRVVSDNGDVEFVGPAHEQALSAPAPAAIDLPGQRIGTIIRATRENLGYSLEQVSKETRVHLSHLRAIEDMTPNLLGAPVYAKGYIRSYARHLGLDENATLERYLRECAILKDPEKQTIAPPSTGRKLPVAVPVFGFLIVALAGAAAAFFLMNGEQSPPPTVASSAPPSGAALAPPQAGTAGGVDVVATPLPAKQQLRIVAVKRGLIEVRSAAGDKYVRRIFEPGESYPVRVGYGWTVTAPEDGSAFEWRLGDQSLGLLTNEGPAYSQSVDLAAKRPPIDPPLPVTDITEPEPVIDAEPTAPAAAPPPRSATASPSAAASSAAPSGSPGSRIATPPAASSSTPPKPKPPKPQPKPQAETPPPIVSANPPPAGQLPTTAPTTPAQDPALLAYPGQ